MAIWLHFQNSVQKYYCIISSSSWARKWIRIVRNRVTKWRSRCYFSYGFIYGRITPSVTMSPHNDLWWSLEIGNKIRICHTLSRVLTRRRGRHMQSGCWHSSLAQVNWSAQQATAQSIGLYHTGARAARRRTLVCRGLHAVLRGSACCTSSDRVSVHESHKVLDTGDSGIAYTNYNNCV